MIVIARTSTPSATVRRTARQQLVCNRYLQPVTVARTSSVISLQRYSAPFATVRLPHFPEIVSGLMGADGSFLMGADGTILQGADA